MEILQLKYFCYAAKSENFSKTAKNFGVPPSDISQSVRRLENELGVRLFDRRANSIILNEKGKRFYKKASAALQLLEDASAEAGNSSEEGKISIAININRRIAMRAVEIFRRRYPKVDITVKHSVFDDLADFDLLITADNMAAEGMLCEKLLCETIGLAVNKNDPLAKADRLTAELLTDKPFVSMNSGNSLHALTVETGKRLGFEPHIAIQSDDPFYIRRCVELGLAIAVFPTLSWKGLFSSDVVIKDLGNHTRETFVCRKSDRFLSDCTERFLELLREEFSQADR